MRNLIAIALLITQTQQPMAFDEKDGIRIEISKTDKLSTKACEFYSVIFGPTLHEYKSITVVASIATGADSWVDLPKVEIDLPLEKGSWWVRGEEADVAKWTGAAKIRIVGTKIKPEAIESRKAALEAKRAEAERQTLIKKQPRGIQKLLLDRKIKLGLTKEQVLLSWGHPNSVVTTVSAQGFTQQWIYGLGEYIYFNGDRVTSWQTHR
ncbi:hypothetical protein [Geothrix sp.]|jgi:hypothetical protein|uniref:hypothetical protein n=1 Tax=Geothrix sp. TaxID=1962974 RepID=UPI0025BB2A49|nr:hypothetical protein [Geothrix sp.]